MAFSIGGSFPLVSYLLGSSSLGIALLVGAVGLFVAGAITSRFTTRSWWLSGLRQLMFGAIAAGTTFVVGRVIAA